MRIPVFNERSNGQNDPVVESSEISGNAQAMRWIQVRHVIEAFERLVAKREA